MKRIFHYLNIAIFFILFTAKLQAQTCIVITHPDDLTITTTNTDASCNGISTGKIVANASGGTTPYEYSIDAVNFVPSNTFSNLAAGAYSISVKDANGCTKAIAVTLTEPSGLSGAISSSENSCTIDDNKVLQGASASFTVSATGGTTPYAYIWSDALGTNSTATATVNVTNNYNVTITDNQGCIFIPSKTITVIDAPSVAIAATETSCTNNDDKVLVNANVDFKATASGGLATYTYAWDNSLGTADIANTSVTATTIYNVTATDSNGCTATAAKTITVISAPSVAIAATETSCTNNDDKVLPNANVDFQATASGGLATYTYAWDNALGTADIANTSVSATTIYNVTATDTNGCTATAAKTITVIAAPSVAIAATETSCTNSDDKVLPNTNVSFTATASGGITAYNYLWDNGLGSLATANTNVFSTKTYSVTVSDANGCTATDSKTITVLPGLSLTKVITQPSCNAANGSLSGAIDITLSGVSGTPTFIWSNAKTTEDLDNLGTGTYIVSVTDANGCMVTDSTNIVEPALLNAGTGANPAPICSGNSLVPIVLNDLLTGENAGGTWTLESGTPIPTTAFDNTANTFAIKGTSVGVYVFKYQMGTVACGDSENVSITIQDCCPVKICSPVKVTKK